MFQLRDASLTCARDGCDGRYDWLPKEGCFECPLCGMTEWGAARKNVTTMEARMVWRLQLAYVDTLRKHGGGSRMAGRKRKGKPRKFIEGVQPWFRDY